MTSISTWRLHALRAGYLLLVVGLGLTVWPAIVHHDNPWSLTGGVVKCMLGALSLLAGLGLRDPLRLLPLLLFELVWKTLWLTVVALPLWSAHQLDADSLETAYECLIAVVFLVIIPWDYVFGAYVLGAPKPSAAPASSMVRAAPRS